MLSTPSLPRCSPDNPGTIEAVTWIEDEYWQRLADGRTQIPAAMRRNYAMGYWWDQWIKVRSVGAK